jgi:hypothetical protein
LQEAELGVAFLYNPLVDGEVLSLAYNRFEIGAPVPRDLG